MMTVGFARIRGVMLALAGAAIAPTGGVTRGAAQQVTGGELRALTVDDILRMEDIGRVALTPDGKTLVYEWLAPYERAPNIETLYSTIDRSALAKLYTIDLARADASPRPLFEQAAPGGYWLGGLSPDASHADVYSLIDGEVKAGVFEFATGQVRWFDFTPNYYWEMYRPVWISNDELVYAALPPGRQPSIVYRSGMVARINDQWQKTFAGKEPSAMVLTSTRSGIAEANKFAPGKLLRVNARSGAVAELADGYFLYLRLSPDRRYLAALRQGGAIQPTQKFAYADFHRLLMVFDLAPSAGDASELVPCSTCNTQPNSVEWTGDGARLRFRARQLEDEPRQEKPFEYTPATRALASAEAESKPPEGGAMDTPTDTRIGQTGEALFVLHEGDVWRVDADSGRRNLTSRVDAELSQWAPFSAESFYTGGSPIATNSVVLEAADQILRLDLGSSTYESIPRPHEGAELLAVAEAAPIALFKQSGQSGWSLVAAQAGRPARVLFMLNRHLAAIAPTRHAAVRYEFQDTTLSSCVMLPPDWTRSKRYPLIVSVYPIHSGRCADDDTTLATFDGIPYTSQLMTARGYVVLKVANPPRLVRTPEGPTQGLTPLVLAAVDAAIKEGYADPERIGIHGVSQGHHSVLQTITQTARFKAAVAEIGISNAFSHYGSIPASVRYGWDNIPFGSASRYESSGARPNGLGVKPWDDPMAYVRESPVLFANRIETPLLLIHSDFDQFPLGQSEEMFTALYRLRKEATYVTYWGEGHGLLSPANIRDSWRRIFDWFDEHLAPDQVGMEGVLR